MSHNEGKLQQEREELWGALKNENIETFDTILSEILIRTPSIEEAWAVFKIASDTRIQIRSLQYIALNTPSEEDIREVIHCALYYGWTRIVHFSYTRLFAHKQEMLSILPQTIQDCWVLFSKTKCFFFQEVILEYICTHHASFENILKVRLCGMTYPAAYRKSGNILRTFALKELK